MKTTQSRLILLAGIAALPFVVGCSSSQSASGTGGGSGSGGSSGSGGAGVPSCPGSDELISDFTSDNGVHQVDGRQGGWYTYGDSSGRGTLSPPQGGAATPDSNVGNTKCSGPGSLHVTAMGFTDWGSAMGVDFVPSVVNDAGAGVKGTYDASKYRGISFWAKAAAGSAIKFVQVSLLDPYTGIPSILPANQTCAYSTNPMDPAMTAKNCSPYLVKFGYGYTGDDLTNVTADYPGHVNDKIDDTWRQFVVLFSETKQDRGNPGQPSPGNKLDVAQLMGMAIQINTDHSTMPPTANDYEVWVDDVAFVK